MYSDLCEDILIYTFSVKIHESSPSIIVSVRQAGLYECAVCSMRKEMKLISDGGDCGRKKYKLGYCGAYDGVWRRRRLAEV
jgi:hypothetical protein